MRHSKTFLLLAFLTLSALVCVAQQDYVARLDSEFGVNIKPWAGLGGDFSWFQGGSSVLPAQLNPTTSAKLAAFAPLFPPGYNLYVPYSSTTYTLTAGGQLNYRHFKKFTLFGRPDLGYMHQSITANPHDQLTAILVPALLGGKNTTTDSSAFYGIGGGIDLNVSRPVGIRLMADWVHTTLFTNLLANGQNTIRFTIGPTFRFGKNIMGK